MSTNKLFRRVIPLAARPAHTPSSALVGRTREIAAIEEGLARARAGTPSHFLVSGAAGAGKTSLAEEAARRARPGQDLVLWGRCWEDGGAPPFWPWLQILRGAVRRFGADSGEGRACAALAREIEPTPDDGRRTSSLGSEHDRFLLFDRFLHLLSDLSTRHLVVLVVDDVQAADHASLHLLHFLLHHLRDARVCTLVTNRQPGGVVDPAKAALLGAIAREAVPVVLGGLSLSEAALTLQSFAELPLPPEAIERFWTRTGGNPLFLRLIGDALRGDPTGWPRTAGNDAYPLWPGGIGTAVEQLASRLGAPCRALLRVASVIGVEFDEALLLRAAAQPGDRAAPDSPGSSAQARPGEGTGELRLLLEAAEGGLVTTTPDGSAHRFVHGIVRDAIYAGIPAWQRLQLHAAVGHACEAIDPSLETHLDQAAHHFLQAAPAGWSRKAIDLQHRSGRRALERLAPESAVAHFARARDLAQALGDRRLVCRQVLALGEAHARGTDAVEADRCFREGVRLARELDDAVLAGTAALLLADVGAGLPLDSAREGQTGLLVLDALRRLPRTDSPQRARLLTRAAALLFEHRPWDERRALAHEGLLMAQRLGDPIGIGHALCDMHAALWSPDNPEQRLEWATEALNLARAGGDDALGLRAHLARILTLFELGDPAALDLEIPGLERRADRLGEPRHLWVATHLRSLAAFVRGRFAESEQLALAAFAHGEKAREPRAQSHAAMMFEVLRFMQGRLEEFEPLIRTNVFDGDDLSVRLGIGLLAAELERPAEAKAVVDSVRGPDGRIALRGDPRAFTVMAAALAQTITFLGDREAARDLRDLLLPYSGRFVTAQHLGTTVDAPVSFYLGCLEATAGRFAEAQAYFASSLASCDRLGARAARARTLLAQGQALLASGGDADRASAERPLGEAAALAAHLGMELVRRRAEVALDRARVAAPDLPHGRGRGSPAAPDSTAG